MLVLTRKTGESIIVGDEIVITVQNIRGNAVRLSIAAPQEVPIIRSELIERIEREEWWEKRS